MAELVGNEVASTAVPATQVYKATHKGEKYLPFMNRSFISFSFGYKKDNNDNLIPVHIEDFNLIATIENNRITRNGYAAFEDLTSTYNNLDGQYYWNTHYKANEITFSLATDGITQKELDEFLRWFRAGEIRELILAEHPNREILARVKNPPQLSLLPFDKDVQVTLSSVTYTTKTTIYKGNITLTLVMDEPFWHAIKNILGEEVDGHYKDTWTGPNGESVSIYASQDALKILYEDGIPLGSMIDNNMLLGDESYASVESNVSACIWSISEEADDYLERGEGARIHGTIGDPLSGLQPEGQKYPDGTYVGIIAGALIDVSGNGISSLQTGQEAYFFYAGTAPAPLSLSFQFTPEMDGQYYITVPFNSHTSPTYNTITIKSLNEINFNFTTPNIFTSYNKVLDIFSQENINSNTTKTWTDIYQMIRDTVRHPAMRAWATAVIDFQTKNNVEITNTAYTTLRRNMSYVFKSYSDIIFSTDLTFNGKTGEAIGAFTYRIPTSMDNYSQSDLSMFGIYSSREEEDIGDMLQSNYLIIKDRNYPTESGKIVKWEDTNDTTRQYSHVLTHNLPVPISNIKIMYQNLYL